MEDWVREPRRMSMKRVLGATLGVVVALAFPAVATAVPPAASFTVSPASPLTLEPVTFTSTSTGDFTSLAWDLDNNGLYNNGTNPDAQLTFSSAAVYTVRLRVAGPEGTGERPSRSGSSTGPRPRRSPTSRPLRRPARR